MRTPRPVVLAVFLTLSVACGKERTYRADWTRWWGMLHQLPIEGNSQPDCAVGDVTFARVLREMQETQPPETFVAAHSLLEAYVQLDRDAWSLHCAHGDIVKQTANYATLQQMAARLALVQDQLGLKGE